MRLQALHVACVWAMTGIIWLIQGVHYPLFAYVAPERFAAFHAAHSQRITYIVGPLMCIELLTALVTFVERRNLFWGLCAALSLACFALTAFVSVPLHERLGLGWDAATHARLVASNGWRTAAWSVHALLLLAAQSPRQG